MKIAFIYDFPYPWHTGGIEKIKWIEAAELAKMDEVHFFTMRWPGMQSEFVENGIHYHTFRRASVHTMYRHHRRSMRKALEFSIGLLRLFRYRFDVVVIDQFPYIHIPVVMLYRALTGCKVVMSAAEVWDRQYWDRYVGRPFGNLAYAYSRAVVRGANHYIANSYMTASALESIFQISKQRISVFAPVIDADMVSAARKSSRKAPLVVFAGRLIKEKRLDEWLYAFSVLLKYSPGARGLIIGDGPERKAIASAIKKMKLTGSVELRMPIKSSLVLFRIIAGASAMLNMSEREGLSMITLESLALGTPVVLPDSSPIPDEVKRMCVVRKQVDIPGELSRIIKSRGLGFIKDTSGLADFYSSNTRSFYVRLFRKLGLHGSK